MAEIVLNLGEFARDTNRRSVRAEKMSMRISRRRWLGFGGAALGGTALPAAAHAQGGPSGALIDSASFGLRGDGSDETAALRSALASGESIILRRGEYRSSEPLVLSASGQKLCAGNRTTSLVTPLLEIRGNRVNVTDMRIAGAVAVVDAMFCVLRDLHVFGGGVKLETRHNANGNGTYFTDLHNLEIEEGAIGLHVTGIDAGANRVRSYGLMIGWCTVGVKLEYGDTFTAFQPQITGCQVGLWIPSPNATASLWLRPTFEQNQKHVHIDFGPTDHTFLFPTFGSPTAFGTDHGTRTNWLLTDTSGGRTSILTGTLLAPDLR